MSAQIIDARDQFRTRRIASVHDRQFPGQRVEEVREAARREEAHSHRVARENAAGSLQLELAAAGISPDEIQWPARPKPNWLLWLLDRFGTPS